jgi:hypothetical protein
MDDIPEGFLCKNQLKSRHTLHNAGHPEATISWAVRQIHTGTWFWKTKNSRGTKHCKIRTTQFHLQILHTPCSLRLTLPRTGTSVPPRHTKIVLPTSNIQWYTLGHFHVRLIYRSHTP